MTTPVTISAQSELAHLMIIARQAVRIELELDSTTNKYKFVGSCYRGLTNTYKDDSAFFELMHDVIRCYHQKANNSYHYSKGATLEISPWLLEILYRDCSMGPSRSALHAVEEVHLQKWDDLGRSNIGDMSSRSKVHTMKYVCDVYTDDFRAELGRSPRE